MHLRSPLAQIGPLLREWLLVLTLMSFAVLAFDNSRALTRLDQAIYDATLQIISVPSSQDVLIVGIDDASLAELGPWPWPASRHGAAIDALAKAGPRAIGYEVMFDGKVASDVVSAAVLRARAVGVPVAMPVRIRVPGTNGRGHDAELPPEGALAGHSTVRQDIDGVVRRLDLALDGDQRWPHISALVAGPMGDAAIAGLPPHDATNGRLERRGERMLGFRGPAGSFQAVPISAVLAGEVPEEFIKGRVILVGVTAAGLGAQFSTAVSGRGGPMSGVEIDATLAADLIEGRVIQATGPGRSLALALVLLWLVMVGMLILRPGVAGLFGFGLMVLLLLLAAAGLVLTGRWAEPAAAAVALLAAPPVWAWRRLVVVNDWMTRELNTLGDFGLPHRRRFIASDPVTRTTEMLAATIDRVEELRRLADAALRGLPDATVLVSEGGAIVAANAAAEELFGPELHGGAVDAAFADNDLPPFGARALADPDSPWRGEFTAKDGTAREVRFTPWRDADGAPLGWIVRFADISALRRAEAAREEALQLLTHDMRAPQASILALVDRTTGLPTETAERLRQLARRTISLADGYLQLARADAGGYAMGEIDLAAIATEAVDELWPLATARGIRIVGDGLEAESMAWGNHGLLLRAVINLLGNAVKFAPADSVVGVRLQADAQDWRLDISDAGPGVSVEIQAQLFNRFRTGGDAGGVGLGLAFVKAVADGHGGYALCTSVPGEGATFSLYLPGTARSAVAA
ncbi:CHASE2 domain-containing protein [Polymorphobacter multimanifer]|uniref:CHASE2 domain-containing protein n=1 Tax=Polymorphobacter multimanifer TaxID=1070431 RepID=UPI001A9C63B1|nr:CHASE2 domain-containing protein [Polymorphobacter multimanifer]